MPGSHTPESPKRARKKRRIRSPHPGVVLIPPAGRHATWRARFKDPDSGKLTWLRLDPTALPSADARREWAKKKSHALLGRDMDIKSGAPRIKGTPLADAVEEFFKANKALRDGTIENYRTVADKFVAWAADAGLKKTDALTRAKLLDFKTLLVDEKKKLHLAGSKRKELILTDEPRSPHTINGDLRKTATILGQLIERDLLPRLKRDDLKVAFKKVPAAIERIDYLKPSELRKLFEAALRHDAELFVETRLEHTGAKPPGSTYRYQSVAPILAALVLTGMRLGEALSLDWKQVDLDAFDHDGEPVGEIHLEGAANKTHRARTIGLEVSPALRSLLAALRLKTGGKGSVFGLTEGVVDAAIKRLQQEGEDGYGAPEFSAQKLRRTCGTYLTNAHGIFGAASAYRSAKQLGHAVQVAEKHYVNVARGIPRDARDLETAMQVDDLMAEVVKRVGVPADRPKLSVVR